MKKYIFTILKGFVLIGFIILLSTNFSYEREPQFPYIRSATILNTNTATNKIPIHLMNLNATLITK